jgi:NitT/TauT family transport system ATP-binding protein
VDVPVVAKGTIDATADDVMAGSSASAAPKIQIEGVSKWFGGTTHPTPALLDISLEVHTNEFVCLLGPSGCGKSTLLNIVAGFIPPSVGRVLADGTAVAAPGPDRGVVFQEYALFPWLTVEENVEFGPKLKGIPRPERQQVAEKYLDLVGLSAHRRKFPAQLSGGMKQRVAIARALANNPTVILMDEPFGSLDAQTREVMQEELSRLQRLEHKTILFVTHSIREAVYLADRVVVMTSSPGKIKDIVRVDLSEPRDKFSQEFTHYESDITHILKEEVEKAREG